ncbi:hypothetical protein D3C72_955400 [compost metagenome]
MLKQGKANPPFAKRGLYSQEIDIDVIAEVFAGQEPGNLASLISREPQTPVVVLPSSLLQPGFHRLLGVEPAALEGLPVGFEDGSFVLILLKWRNQDSLRSLGYRRRLRKINIHTAVQTHELVSAVLQKFFRLFVQRRNYVRQNPVSLGASGGRHGCCTPLLKMMKQLCTYSAPLMLRMNITVGDQLTFCLLLPEGEAGDRGSVVPDYPGIRL